MIKEAEIYLFDDSFSALDFATDRQLRTAINHSEKHKNKIKVIVAQRIATVMSADQILVLENGIAVGLGTHERQNPVRNIKKQCNLNSRMMIWSRWVFQLHI